MVSTTLALGKDLDCEIESSEIIKSDKTCTCISSQHRSMTDELESFKEKLSNSEKELELATKKLKECSDDFVTFNCEINDEDPKLCVVQNLIVDKENMKAIKALVPESSFSAVKDLTELEILNSNTKFIPTNIFDVLTSLEALTIIRSSLTSITRGSFKGANNIYSITIEGNELSNIGPHIFEGAETVLHMFLSENGIKTVSPDAFKGLKGLKALSLRGNELKELDVNLFQDNISLRKLTFSYNHLKEINNDLLKNNRELVYLKFDHNRLSYNYDHKNLTQYAKKELFSDFKVQQQQEGEPEESVIQGTYLRTDVDKP
ncbi:unnamed protein product [Diamesa hyperborea]